MINKNLKKIFKNYKEINEIKDLNTNCRPSDLRPDIYYKITEQFEKLF
jgi:hypothetical protein